MFAVHHSLLVLDQGNNGKTRPIPVMMHHHQDHKRQKQLQSFETHGVSTAVYSVPCTNYATPSLRPKESFTGEKTNSISTL
jgi:hypothetical protein